MHHPKKGIVLEQASSVAPAKVHSIRLNEYLIRENLKEKKEWNRKVKKECKVDFREHLIY